MTAVPATSPPPRDPSLPAAMGFQAVLRAVRPMLGRAADSAAHGVSLERLTMGGDPPSVATCIPLEPAAERVCVAADVPGVRAFLDGVQRSRVAGYVEASPIIIATVAAAIRERVDRRLTTWRTPLVRHLVLASRATLGDERWAELEATGITLCDAAEDRSGTAGAHPFATRARALAIVSEHREQCERRLAADWCAAESEWLWIDGGVSGHLAVDADTAAFGVVKSHTTLYGDADTLRAVLQLPAGARSPLFLVQHHGRRAVASWYVRLHVARDGDPLHGLVRVEVAPPDWHAASPQDSPPPQLRDALTVRADTITRWILAERAPLSLPDPRWDTLTYGVSACEHFLHALIGP